MNLKELQKDWDQFGKTDPLWSILTAPDKKGNKWEIGDFFDTGRKEIDSIMKYVESLGIKVQTKKALDFGCGVGRLTQALAYYFDEVYGVDIAPSMIELAEKYNNLGDKCKYYLNESGDLELFNDNSFNFIYSSLTLLHMKPKYSKNYIREFLRILVPDGVLIFHLPSERIKSNATFKKILRHVVPARLLESAFYWRIHLKSMLDKEPRMDVYSIEKREIVSLLKENGTKIVDIRQDQNNGSSWVSLRYCVMKEPY